MKTSRDIARLAGVSQSTVSRVLNNSAGVAPDKAERVRQVIQQTGYEPNALARSFVTRRTEVIGLFMFGHGGAGDRLNNHWTGTVVSAFHSALHEHGYMMMLDLVHTPAQLSRAASVLRQKRVDGAIFFGGRHDFDVAPALSAGLPVAVVNRRWVETPRPNVVQVTVDNFGGAKAATEHLVALGHRRIAFLAWDIRTTSAVIRHAGFKAALEPLGLYDPNLTARESVVYHHEELVALFRDQWRTDRPTGIVAFNDDIATRVINAAREAGLRVPEDLSVVGFDNWGRSQYPLTTVNLDVDGMCRLGVESVLRMVEGEQMQGWDMVLPCPLVVRETSAPPPARC